MRGKKMDLWQRDVDKIKAKFDLSRQGEIIFYGASNFALWERMEEDLREYKVQNHAFGGSRDVDLMEYAGQMLIPYHPRIVVFQTGSNDYVEMDGSDTEKIERCMAYKSKMFTDFHERMQGARFIIMSGLLLPGRKEYLEMTRRINERLKAYSETKDYMVFVDAEKLTFDGAGLCEELFREDRIHLNHEGQKKWCGEYIRPALEALIEAYNLQELRTNHTQGLKTHPVERSRI